MSYEVKTRNGYDFFEVSSAFQKSVRRGEEEEAMFWAVELLQSNYSKYVWKRMVIMASEDVGLGDPDCSVRIMALKQMYDFLDKEEPKKLNKRLPFIQAVLTLVHAKKSRYVDLCHSVYWKYHNDNVGKKQVPDYALDMHTRKGKKMDRGLEHFYDEGAKINNTNKMPREENYEKLARQADEQTGNNPDADLPKDDNGNEIDLQNKLF